MNILIADDHAATRRGLQEILAEAFPAVQFENAANAIEVMEKLSAAEYELLLLDINMPGRSGLEALKDIRRLYPRLPVIVVSIHPEQPYAAICLKLGASAYISKDTASEELVPAAFSILEDSYAKRL